MPAFSSAGWYLKSAFISSSSVQRTVKRMEPITTGQIYWGAVPFVFIQVFMVLLVIFFPAMVMHYKGVPSNIDLNKVKIEVPQIELPPPLDFSQPPNIK